MRTIEITACQINELSEKAQEKAHSKWLENFEYHWSDDNKASLEAFQEVFPVHVSNWEYGYRNNIDWHFTHDDCIKELSGARLAKYLWNNYREYIYKGKYYSLWSQIDQNPHYTERGTAPWVKLKSRHSRIKLQSDGCPFTGYTADYSLLHHIYEFIDSPDHRDFEDLINDCLGLWLQDCTNDYEYCQSLECFIQEAEANEWEYTEEGEQI